MNLKNFEKHIDKIILERGYDYYREGNVMEGEEYPENVFKFYVEGTQDYEVIVKIDDSGEIQDSECNCPYDFGSICKHEVAAYFELKDMLNYAEKKIVQGVNLRELLQSIPKEVLIDIIVERAKEDTTFQNSIIYTYSNTDDEQSIVECKRLIDSIVKKYLGREGFIPFREVGYFTLELEEVLKKVEHTEDVLLGLDIALLVLHESIKAFQYADDSGGDIGMLVEATLGLIEEIVWDGSDFDRSMREKIFHKLLEQTDGNIFDGWEDFRIVMLKICAGFADDEAFRIALRKKLENFINQPSDNSYMGYYKERMSNIVFEVIEKYGTEKETEQYIQENLTFTSFRKLYIDKHMEEKNYQKVIEVALEGERQDTRYPGLIKDWKKYRYAAYKELSQKEEQENLARELLFDGEFEFYQELKELATEDTENLYVNLREEAKNGQGWHLESLYLFLIRAENDVEEILEYVRAHPQTIESYLEILKEKYSNEVIEVYQSFVKEQARISSDRKAYKKVCQIIKRYGKVAGKEKRDELINELQSLYKKRPAFLDELSKI